MLIWAMTFQTDSGRWFPSWFLNAQIFRGAYQQTDTALHLREEFSYPLFSYFFSHQHEDFSSIDSAGSAVLLKSSNCAIHLFRSVEFIITVIRFSELSMQIIPLQSRVKSMQFIPPKYLFQKAAQDSFGCRDTAFFKVLQDTSLDGRAKHPRSGISVCFVGFFCLFVLLYNQVSTCRAFWCTGTAH